MSRIWHFLGNSEDCLNNNNANQSRNSFFARTILAWDQAESISLSSRLVRDFFGPTRDEKRSKFLANLDIFSGKGRARGIKNISKNFVPVRKKSLFDTKMLFFRFRVWDSFFLTVGPGLGAVFQLNLPKVWATFRLVFQPWPRGFLFQFSNDEKTRAATNWRHSFGKKVEFSIRLLGSFGIPDQPRNSIDLCKQNNQQIESLNIQKILIRSSRKNATFSC